MVVVLAFYTSDGRDEGQHTFVGINRMGLASALLRDSVGATFEWKDQSTK
jgi:hypothetical protein